MLIKIWITFEIEEPFRREIFSNPIKKGGQIKPPSSYLTVNAL